MTTCSQPFLDVLRVALVRLTCGIAVALAWGGLLEAQDSAKSTAGKDTASRPMFNGRDLDGWVPVNTAPSTWSVRDGLLICTGKPIGELRTARMYQNFVLELEWRHLVPKGNAGVFVWADDITARGVPFHRGIEVQVLENAYGNNNSHTTHGDIFPIHGAEMTPINGRGGSRAFPTEFRSKPSPEWNHYRIECRDGNISLAVNGQVVTRGEACSPRKGYICLESEGGVVHYRNVRITELPDTPVAQEHIATANRNFRCLYNGVDLAGWKMAADWRPADWILNYEGLTASHLATDESFSDVGFVVDFQLSDSQTEAAFVVRGARVSVGQGSPHGEQIRSDDWNRAEGTLVGDRLTLVINGTQVANGKQVDAAAAGPLRLESNAPAKFANIYVRKVDSE